MGMIKLLSAPIRSIVRFPLFQLAIVVAVILFLQSADENSAFGQIFNGLDKLVDATVTFFSAIFTIKSFTKSWLTSGFMIAYVYLGCLLILFLVRVTIRVVVDFIGRSNLFWLRNAIARERGIEAYRAWVPFERIRPAHIPQEKWEQAFAWPANNQPPYPPLTHRIFRGILFYGILILFAAVLLQAFTRFSVLTWLVELATRWRIIQSGSNLLNVTPELLQEFLAHLSKPDDEIVTLYADGRAVEIPVVWASGARSRAPRNYRHFNEPLIEVNLVFSFVPRPFTTAMIASAIPAAINPYSIAAAPD
jgi:hypothetical protein